MSRGAESAERFHNERARAEISIALARWILDPNNQLLLANAIHQATKEYETTRDHLLVMARNPVAALQPTEAGAEPKSPRAQKMDSDSDSGSEQSAWATACSYLSWGVSVVATLSGKMSEEFVNYLLTNRALELRNKYGFEHVKFAGQEKGKKDEEPTSDEMPGQRKKSGKVARCAKNEVVDTVPEEDDFEQPIFEQGVKPEKAVLCFFDMLSGDDGWTIQSHTLFIGRVSLKTQIMQAVMTAFSQSPSSEPYLTGVNKFDFLNTRGQAREVFLQLMVEYERIQMQTDPVMVRGASL